MWLHLVATLAVLVAQASAASNSSELNGWYPCVDYTFSDAGSSTGQEAECALFKAPLCYPGICETPDNVNTKVDIFFKRLPATAGNPETASNVWLLQGGPVEVDMMALHQQLEGAVNVYTMDHRGTGRSTLLDCVAAQVTTTGSRWGKTIDPSEVPACAQELQNKYGNLASFSVTTAATDLATFMSKFTNGASTILYGVSCGTMLLERLMHLAPPQVTGYILDSIAATSGNPADKRLYLSEWATNFDEVTNSFLSLCEEDNVVKTRFESVGLNGTIHSLFQQFDNDPNSTCATLIKNVKTEQSDADPPSFALRLTLGTLLKNSYLRTFIPPVVYRLNRCSRDDVDVLTQFVSSLNENLAPTQDDAFYSSLLFYLITLSEMWDTPSPSMSEMKKQFTDALMSDERMYPTTSLYCAFSKEKSAACDELGFGNYDANGIIYKRDQYWNKTATIPSNASVLLLNGKLDCQTPHKYAEFLFDVLDGDKKELITFDYASHVTVATTQMIAGDPWSETCGRKLLASYVRAGGDLERLDKSCVDAMPSFNVTTPSFYVTGLLSTDDAYDGVYNASLSS